MLGQIQDPNLKPPRLRNILIIGTSVYGAGVVIFQILEDYSWVDSIYFTMMTLTTIGYGDIVPKTDAGKLFTTLYAIFGIAIFASIVNYLLRRSVIKRIQKHQK